MSAYDDEFLSEFLTEATEHLESAEEQLLLLADGDGGEEELNGCFRSLHTIKGGSGFLDLHGVQKLAHVTETLLDDICQGRLEVDNERLHVLLEGVSQLQVLIEGIAEAECEGSIDDLDLGFIKKVESLCYHENMPHSSDAHESPIESKNDAQDSQVPEPEQNPEKISEELFPLTSMLEKKDSSSDNNSIEEKSARTSKKVVHSTTIVLPNNISTYTFDLCISRLLISGNDNVPQIIELLGRLKKIAEREKWTQDCTDTLDRLEKRIDDLVFPQSDIDDLVNAMRAAAEQLAFLVHHFHEEHPSHDHIEHETSALHGNSDDNEKTELEKEKSKPHTKNLAENTDVLMPADSNSSIQYSPLLDGLDYSRIPTPEEKSVEHDDETLSEFTTELNELLDEIEGRCLNAKIISTDDFQGIFRNFHTIKGMSAYIEIPHFEKLAHHFEEQLIPIRDGDKICDLTSCQLILEAVDIFRTLSVHLIIHRGEGTYWPDNVIAFSFKIDCPQICLPPKIIPVLQTHETETADHDKDESTTNEDQTPRLGDMLVEQGVDRKDIEKAELEKDPEQLLGERLVQTGVISRKELTKAIKRQKSIKSKIKKDASTRVSTEKLDDLVNMVGELLISHSMITSDLETIQHERLQQSSTRMDRIVKGLQQLSLSLRMIPLKSTFQKMSRAVHDTARKVDKEIHFILRGEDTEIDRTLAENLADPLLHMVRNAVDHGIEDAELRKERGKPSNGTIILEANQGSDHVSITLSDDGGGMDPEKLRNKAIEKGLISSDLELDEQACFQLIFSAGFSTAAAVTGISGRGVGMDVVRKNIQGMGGSIEIESEIGSGTNFHIKLPLTTAILEAMLIRCGGERFFIPIASIIEAMRPEEEQIHDFLGHQKAFRYRDEIIPIVHLGNSFEINDAVVAPSKSTILIIGNRNSYLAIQVDEIIGQQQAVIKPLAKQIPHHPALSGSAILSDGNVALIIDPQIFFHHQDQSSSHEAHNV